MSMWPSNIYISFFTNLKKNNYVECKKTADFAFFSLNTVSCFFLQNAMVNGQHKAKELLACTIY